MVEIADNAARRNCAYWATEANKIHLQKGDYSFGERQYLIEPMTSRQRRRAYMKSAQGGGSLAEILKSLWGMGMGYLPGGVLYLFPTSDDMQDYSKGVFGPLIASNPCIKKWIKTAKGVSNAAGLKSVNGANLYMRGAGLSQIIEGEGESTKLKGITVDKVVFDEIELMDKDALAKAIGRMRDSTVKEEVYIGNPGIPGRGIDEVFSLSDQRHWFRKCQKCNEWTCAELTFPECVKIRPDGTGYIGCKKCGQRVYVADGEWVPQYREKSDYMHGYRWSCLTTPHNDPAEILDEFVNPPLGNLGDVYRLSLGLPYIAAEDRLTTAQVYSRCGHGVMAAGDPGPCAFGLDVGKICRLVIGRKIGRATYEIVKLARLSDWNDISKMVEAFNCNSGVIDIRPYENTARNFQKTHKMRIYLCEYSESSPMGTVWNKNTKVVKANRTEICDATHALVAEEGRLILPRRTPEVDQFAKEMCDPAKILEVNKKTKQSVYRYRGIEDHYRHALNYFLLAAERLAISRPGRRSRKKYAKVMNDYARI